MIASLLFLLQAGLRMVVMKIVNLIEKITRFSGYVGAALSFPLIGALVYEVFSRYILGRPTLWAFEVSYMVMGAIFMLGMANTLRIGQHVNVDVMTNIMSEKTNTIIKIIGYLLFIPILIWLVFELSNYAFSAFESGERSGRSAWNPIIWPAYATWLIGFSLLFLQVLAELIKAFSTLIPYRNKRGGVYE